MMTTCSLPNEQNCTTNPHPSRPIIRVHSWQRTTAQHQSCRFGLRNRFRSGSQIWRAALWANGLSHHVHTGVAVARRWRDTAFPPGKGTLAHVAEHHAYARTEQDPEGDQEPVNDVHRHTIHMQPRIAASRL